MRIHRRVWIEHHGAIPKGKHIHHIDGNKRNNSIDNLICVSAIMHHATHKQQWEDKGRLHDYYSTKRLAIEIGSDAPRGGSPSQETRNKISKTLTGRHSSRGREATLFGTTYRTYVEAADDLGIKFKTVHRLCTEPGYLEKYLKTYQGKRTYEKKLGKAK